MNNKNYPHRVLNRQTNWKSLYLYQKSEVVYQLSFSFCNRFIHLYKDRTRDQVIQAARSCKQNIVEGLEDGVTSTEMQLKLLNVARSSLMELREDFSDYLKSRHLRTYVKGDMEYDAMLDYCSSHNKLEDYEPYFASWSDEVMCNYGLSLCHFIDKMMMSFMERLEKEFITEGGIKERMYRARTGHLNEQDAHISHLEADNAQLRANIDAWARAYDELKQRALRAYNDQKEEIAALKARLNELEGRGARD